ncbi:hypothetical protein HOY80DRAFT_365989 [Tuber brumale]|nr:hypothetical protein HOY80DRAFT_365989 [Tuber brumale]
MHFSYFILSCCSYHVWLLHCRPYIKKPPQKNLKLSNLFSPCRPSPVSFFFFYTCKRSTNACGEKIDMLIYLGGEGKPVRELRHIGQTAKGYTLQQIKIKIVGPSLPTRLQVSEANNTCPTHHSRVHKIPPLLQSVGLATYQKRPFSSLGMFTD